MRCKSLDNFWTRPVAILSLENGRNGVRTRVRTSSPLPQMWTLRTLLNDLDYALSRSSINFRHALDQSVRQLVKRFRCRRAFFAGQG